ncbi:hypothetical protein INT48_000793 [Thamnidium elegans]|uniref:Uncharacterized protein n=1 Tax=Thamnidium elegans TaxID=101142 RepID=A0A8H7SUF1_9FUNG|nr:hypothetical protein INT48_000793 [Thamnidium elegans]
MIGPLHEFQLERAVDGAGNELNLSSLAPQSIVVHVHPTVILAEGKKYTLKLSPFDRVSHHVVSLVKIQDANGCVKDLESRDLTIDERYDGPIAFFLTTGEND